MTIPFEEFLAQIEIGNVYYFKSSRINSHDAHPYIIIAKPEGSFIGMMCCTTQWDTCLRFHEMNNTPTSTLVTIEKNDENGFRKESYVDCNRNYYAFTKTEIRTIYESDGIDYWGKIGIAKLEEIVIGMNESELLEKEVLQHLPTFE